MKKKCKLIDNISELFPGLARRPDRYKDLQEWRNGKTFVFSDRLRQFSDDEFFIVYKGERFPCCKYDKKIEETLCKFATEENSVFELEKAEKLMSPRMIIKMIVKIKQYDYNTGMLRYCSYKDESKEDSIFIFDIHTIKRLHMKDWKDGIKGFKGVFQEDPDEPFFYSKGPEERRMRFEIGKEYISPVADSSLFYIVDYYGDGDGDDETPFRFCIDLVDVFRWFSDLIVDPSHTKQKIFHIEANQAAYLAEERKSDWAAKEIKLIREVTHQEIIEYFSDSELLRELLEMLSDDKEKSEKIWEDYVNYVNSLS